MLAIRKQIVYFSGILKMNELSITHNHIPSMDIMAINRVRKIEEMALSMPQIEISTSHIIHSGMYARTITIPTGVMITGVLIKIATILIIQGNVIVYIGEEKLELCGYNILPASANRKQAFFALTDVHMTMIFPSEAKNIFDAEEQFTDDADKLISRKDTSINKIIITGE